MRITLSSDALEAVIDATGSELVSLHTAAGTELMWGGGAEWPRHAPILFPIIGRLPDDTLIHRGRAYPMPQHGFARDSPFRVIDSTSHSARLVLESSAETLARYPFQFRLETEWRAEARGLSVSFTLTNTGDEPMPASLGWHPAFAWDSSPGWGVSFAEPERSPVRRVDANVRLLDEPDPYLTGARTLPLTEDLFDRGALIFAQAKDRAITYSSPAAAVFDLDFSDFPQFAVWKYPGAHFVCLEPWHGLPSPAGFTGDITSMPHQMSLSPGETRNFRCTLTLTAEACMPSASAIPCPRPSR